MKLVLWEAPGPYCVAFSTRTGGVSEGPFRFSRNPIYVSHVALIFGLGLFLGSPFTLLLTPVLALGLTKLAIEPEERHLLGKFGDDYRSYMARTRRWL